MSLIVSVSGIRGTIGGHHSENLTPIDIVNFISSYASWLKQLFETPKVIVGRDARISGQIVSDIAIATLQSMGINVIDAGLSTTPSIEMAVILQQLQGGIILTASHNPKEWNALKLLNHKGEFLTAEDGQQILSIKENNNFLYETIDNIGTKISYNKTIEDHVDAILKLDLISIDKIRQAKFHIAVDPINSTGSISIPVLLDKLHCTYTMINDDLSGNFAHNPEPLDAHLSELKQWSAKAHLGIAVDPDVDRLALVDETGTYFGEEYSLVAISDYVLSKKSGNTVSNLSSSRALQDLTASYGRKYYASAVGEAHVVKLMKSVDAVIGGEGNGGIILPALHYGRDSLVGIALLLSYMAESKLKLSELKNKYSVYHMSKDKIVLPKSTNYNDLIKHLIEKYKGEKISQIDGLKIDFENAWLHLRKSNTEPIIRIYSEAMTAEESERLIAKIKVEVDHFCTL